VLSRVDEQRQVSQEFQVTDGSVRSDSMAAYAEIGVAVSPVCAVHGRFTKLDPGVIYESTPDGRQPSPGAEPWAEHLMEVAQATTRSDRAGGRRACISTNSTGDLQARQGRQAQPSLRPITLT
jgi:hypothetical protein